MEGPLVLGEACYQTFILLLTHPSMDLGPGATMLGP